MRKLLNIILPIFIIFQTNIFAQNIKTEAIENFYFDAVVFVGDTLNNGRLDVLLLVPYQTLNFIKSGDIFGASYEIEIQITDTLGNKVENSRTNKTIREKEYFVTRGGTGEFDFSQTIFHLKPGKYRITTRISDKFSKQFWEKERFITVLDFGEYDFSLSGILLLNSVEEVAGKYKITPHISDNIANLESGFFIFFEAYNTRFVGDSVDFVWEIYNLKDELIAYSNRIRKEIPNKKNQLFIKIPKIDEIVNGAYLLKLNALYPDTTNDISKSNILAITQRTINYTRTIGGNVLNDIDLAIKQLRYVAYQNDIDYMNQGKTTAEKQKRFEAFWKKLDPSPGTDRNEAFEEYYSRIEYANKVFKAYQEGWMTDKGMIYIIFGPPYTNERQNNFGDSRIYEKWTYLTNREFIFVDNSGFGDFHLLRPMSINEKYRYLR